VDVLTPATLDEATLRERLQSIDALAVGLSIIDLGGGRLRKEDPIDHAAGLHITAGVGDRVRKDDPLVEVRAASLPVAERALARLDSAWQIVPQEVGRPPHILFRVDRDGVTRPDKLAPRG